MVALNSPWRPALEEAIAAGDTAEVRRRAAAALGRGEPDRQRRDEVLEALAGAAASGSSAALEVLAEVVDQQGLVRSAVGAKLLYDDEAVEEVSQETQTAMIVGIGRFRGSARFTTWLFRIANNKAVDYLRRHKRSQVPAEAAPEDWARKISSLVTDREHLVELVNQLPDHYRLAVSLREVDQLSYAEMAERLGLNINTAKSHVKRGREMLLGMIGDGHQR